MSCIDFFEQVNSLSSEEVEASLVHSDIQSEDDVRNSYIKITEKLIKENKTITTMESCTSGQVASLITDSKGSSAVIKGAYVTYSNEAKIMNGVAKEVIDTYGVYSKETAYAMAVACKNSYVANIGIGITGSLGNVDENNPDSIVGSIDVCILSDEKVNKIHISLPEMPSRFACKMAVAQVIGEMLEKHFLNH